MVLKKDQTDHSIYTILPGVVLESPSRIKGTMPSNSWNNGSALQESWPQDKNGLMWQYQVHPVAFWEDEKGTGEIATRYIRITWKRKVGSQYFNFSSKHYKVSNAAIIPQEVQKSLNSQDWFIFYISKEVTACVFLLLYSKLSKDFWKYSLRFPTLFGL